MIPLRSSWPLDCRTLEDDARDGGIYPAQTEPHVHFHEHGGVRHSHRHVHPSEHAHSARSDIAFTEEHVQ